jgi:hypothetical protein
MERAAGQLRWDRSPRRPAKGGRGGAQTPPASLPFNIVLPPVFFILLTLTIYTKNIYNIKYILLELL